MPADRPFQPEEEQLLIQRTKRGDRDAFARLVKGYRERAFAAAFVMVRNQDDARDLSQQAFIRAWRAIDRFEAGRPFYPWLHRILKNLCLTHLKREGPGRKVSLDEMLEENPGAAPTESSGVVDRIHSEQMLGHMRKAIADLKPEFREVLMMYTYQEMQYQEIAEALGIPIGTVMSRLFHARKALADRMAKHRV